MRRIALYLDRPAVVNRDQDSTGIRTIMRAGGMDHSFHNV